MTNLAIKGHPTRGKEVIEILEMLGGINSLEYNSADSFGIYFYISEENNIIKYDWGIDDYDEDTHIFTLEEFLEKYPYKVGDKVLINSDRHEVYTIKSMIWNAFLECVTYRLETIDGIENYHYWFAEEMNRYLEQKEEIMEEKNTSFEMLESNCKDEVKIEFDSSKYEMVKRDNGWYVVKKKSKYPKTYCECCDVLQVGFIYELKYLTKDEAQITDNFISLKRCRDAYWKVYGTEMGLGKPWEPETPTKHYIFTIENNGSDIIKNTITDKWRNRFLVFPTEEMRDAFYENFRYLIDGCKELL